MTGHQPAVEIRGLNADDAAHLLRAVRMWRKHVRSQGGSVPAGFASIEPLLMTGPVSSGQQRPMFAEPLTNAEAVPASTAKVYTLDETAQILRISERTLRRRVAAGQITAFTDGGIKRVRAEDLDAYLDQKGA